MALAVALTMTACGSPPITPSPPPGGGNGGGGVQQPPPVVNHPPTIKTIAASTTRVEVGTPVTLTATVEDSETPTGNLTYTWTAETGTFSGSGPVVTWSPAADAKTPADYVISLTVTETFTSGSVIVENKATSTLTAHVNNSSKELAEMSLRFLSDFANSRVSPEQCVAEFSDSCRGKKDELEDIADNRHDYEVIASTLRHTSLSIAPDRLTATVNTSCSFTSKVITTQPRDEYCANGNCPLGSIQGPVTGNCITTNVYQNGRWWLCESTFSSANGILSDFARSFFGIRKHEIH